MTVHKMSTLILNNSRKKETKMKAKTK